MTKSDKISTRLNFKISWCLETDSKLTALKHNQIAWLPHLTIKEMAEKQIYLAEREKSPYNQSTLGVVAVSLSAFYVEAALNFLVSQHLPDSKNVIKKHRWNEKAKMLTAPFSGNLKPGKHPWQDVAKAFKIRNQLAHPKFAVAVFSSEAPPPLPIFQGVTLPAARRYFLSCCEFVYQIHEVMFGSREFAKIPSKILGAVLDEARPSQTESREGPWWYRITFEFLTLPEYIYEQDIPLHERHKWNFENGRAFTWGPGNILLNIQAGPAT